MASRLRVYLAGPDVFLPDAVAIGRRKKELCAHYGFEGLYPFDNEISGDHLGTRVDLLIYRANVAMIHEADFGIFNLTPFRGSSADVGTVFELGMFAALAKPDRMESVMLRSISTVNASPPAPRISAATCSS